MLSTIRTIPVGALPSHGNGEAIAFRIPAYQRGYRWKREDVTKLLGDLAEFIEEGENGRSFYCLQPLVVKMAQIETDGQSTKNVWEVVDGQQRLTTLFLLWKFLRGAAPFELSYETRPRSREFLDAISEKSPGDISNIDFHHIHHAYQAIQGWFKDDEMVKEGFRNLIADATPNGRNVRFIWYELRENDAVAAFTRLNVGKIPLTDEELIRALFLRNLSGAPLAESAFQHRLALEWDRIETALQSPGFWGFLSSQKPPEGTRIRLLLDLCAPEGAAETDRGIFQHFEAKLRQASPEALRAEWREIFSRFEQLEEWHDDPITYHLVGALATVVSNDATGLLRGLLTDASVQIKPVFVAGLLTKIRSRLMRDEETVSEFVEKLDYHENGKLIRPTLALFNIAKLLGSKGVQTRFPFHFYNDPEKGWDIEHVQSQARDGLGDEKTQCEWLQACAAELLAEPDPGCKKVLDRINEFLERGYDKKKFEELEKSIRQCFGEFDSTEDLHGIGNLTLLDSSTNRAYGNAPFVVKRSEILKAEREGRFLLPCTRDLFLKVYSNNPGSLRRWDVATDGAAHEAEICKTLETFFNGGGAYS